MPSLASQTLSVPQHLLLSVCNSGYVPYFSRTGSTSASLPPLPVVLVPQPTSLETTTTRPSSTGLATRLSVSSSSREPGLVLQGGSRRTLVRAGSGGGHVFAWNILSSNLFPFYCPVLQVNRLWSHFCE